MSRWTAARTGTAASLWAGTPRWLGRYIDGMLSARLRAAAGKG